MFFLNERRVVYKGSYFCIIEMSDGKILAKMRGYFLQIMEIAFVCFVYFEDDI